MADGDAGRGDLTVFVQGMHGLGDNIHQRAVIRELMRDHRVILDTPWPSVYHDLWGDRLSLVCAGTTLRTQAKNLEREAGLFGKRKHYAERSIRLHYPPAEVKRCGSVLAAMSHAAGVPVGDFSLPVPDAWIERARHIIGNPAQPVMVYRPLGERREWGACRNRNPDFDAYHDLFRSIRDRFHVVSIADYAEGQEWPTGHAVQADQTFHRGELDFPALAGLFRLSSLVFTASGFPTVLGQAVGARTVTVFGGYEDASSFQRLPHWLPIEPVTPCACWSHKHDCRKAIDVSKALNALSAFVSATAAKAA